jgi:hypothetical protein
MSSPIDRMMGLEVVDTRTAPPAEMGLTPVRATGDPSLSTTVEALRQQGLGEESPFARHENKLTMAGVMARQYGVGVDRILENFDSYLTRSTGYRPPNALLQPIHNFNAGFWSTVNAQVSSDQATIRDFMQNPNVTNSVRTLGVRLANTFRLGPDAYTTDIDKMEERLEKLKQKYNTYIADASSKAGELDDGSLVSQAETTVSSFVGQIFGMGADPRTAVVGATVAATQARKGNIAGMLGALKPSQMIPNIALQAPVKNALLKTLSDKTLGVQAGMVYGNYTLVHGSSYEKMIQNEVPHEIANRVATSNAILQSVAEAAINKVAIGGAQNILAAKSAVNGIKVQTWMKANLQAAVNAVAKGNPAHLGADAVVRPLLTGAAGGILFDAAGEGVQEAIDMVAQNIAASIADAAAPIYDAAGNTIGRRQIDQKEFEHQVKEAFKSGLILYGAMAGGAKAVSGPMQLIAKIGAKGKLEAKMNQWTNGDLTSSEVEAAAKDAQNAESVGMELDAREPLAAEEVADATIESVVKDGDKPRAVTLVGVQVEGDRRLIYFEDADANTDAPKVFLDIRKPRIEESLPDTIEIGKDFDGLIIKTGDKNLYAVADPQQVIVGTESAIAEYRGGISTIKKTTRAMLAIDKFKQTKEYQSMTDAQKIEVEKQFQAIESKRQEAITKVPERQARAKEARQKIKDEFRHIGRVRNMDQSVSKYKGIPRAEKLDYRQATAIELESRLERVKNDPTTAKASRLEAYYRAHLNFRKSLERAIKSDVKVNNNPVYDNILDAVQSMIMPEKRVGTATEVKNRFSEMVKMLEGQGVSTEMVTRVREIADGYRHRVGEYTTNQLVQMANIVADIKAFSKIEQDAIDATVRTKANKVKTAILTHLAASGQKPKERNILRQIKDVLTDPQRWLESYFGSDAKEAIWNEFLAGDEKHGAMMLELQKAISRFVDQYRAKGKAAKAAERIAEQVIGKDTKLKDAAGARAEITPEVAARMGDTREFAIRVDTMGRNWLASFLQETRDFKLADGSNLRLRLDDMFTIYAGKFSKDNYNALFADGLWIVDKHIKLQDNPKLYDEVVAEIEKPDPKMGDAKVAFFKMMMDVFKVNQGLMVRAAKAIGYPLKFVDNYVPLVRRAAVDQIKADQMGEGDLLRNALPALDYSHLKERQRDVDASEDVGQKFKGLESSFFQSCTSVFENVSYSASMVDFVKSMNMVLADQAVTNTIMTHAGRDALGKLKEWVRNVAGERVMDRVTGVYAALVTGPIIAALWGNARTLLRQATTLLYALPEIGPRAIAPVSESKFNEYADLVMTHAPNLLVRNKTDASVIKAHLQTRAKTKAGRILHDAHDASIDLGMDNIDRFDKHIAIQMFGKFYEYALKQSRNRKAAIDFAKDRSWKIQQLTDKNKMSDLQRGPLGKAYAFMQGQVFQIFNRLTTDVSLEWKRIKKMPPEIRGAAKVRFVQKTTALYLTNAAVASLGYILFNGFAFLRQPDDDDSMSPWDRFVKHTLASPDFYRYMVLENLPVVNAINAQFEGYGKNDPLDIYTGAGGAAIAMGFDIAEGKYTDKSFDEFMKGTQPQRKQMLRGIAAALRTPVSTPIRTAEALTDLTTVDDNDGDAFFEAMTNLGRATGFDIEGGYKP